MTFLFASENFGKLRELRELLKSENIITPSELQISLNVRETGDTFEENARLKAVSACKLTGYPAIADDSGLCVTALGGAPGVHSKRFGGVGLSETQLCELLLKKLENTEQRSAKFVTIIVCRFPNGDEIVASGECEGEITREAAGENGFGYDPVFYVPEIGKTMAQMTADEKNMISHRGKAVRNFAKMLYNKEKEC